MDLALLRFMRTRGHAPAVERAVLVFTRSGEHGLFWLVGSAAGAALDPPRRPLYLRAIRVVVGAYLTNIAMKYAVRRRRPELEGLPALSSTVTSLSYPSAHSTTSFAAARVLSRELPAVPVYACATAMAVSRIYAGVHYPTDIAAGAALGTAMAELIP
jgi:undecaprenyl-diphosphatase